MVILTLLCIGISGLIWIGIVLYDEYRYPTCPLCGANYVETLEEFFIVKRIKGKIICPLHGEVERRK